MSTLVGAALVVLTGSLVGFSAIIWGKRNTNSLSTCREVAMIPLTPSVPSENRLNYMYTI